MRAVRDGQRSSSAIQVRLIDSGRSGAEPDVTEVYLVIVGDAGDGAAEVE